MILTIYRYYFLYIVNTSFIILMDIFNIWTFILIVYFLDIQCILFYMFLILLYEDVYRSHKKIWKKYELGIYTTYRPIMKILQLFKKFSNLDKYRFTKNISFIKPNNQWNMNLYMAHINLYVFKKDS